MTRKRYVKLLMSHGVSRNRANELAQRTRNKGNYADGYKMWKLVNDLGAPMEAIGETFRRFSETVSRVASAICVAASAFSSALTVAMQEPDPFGGRCHRCGGTGVERQMQSLATFDGPSVRGPDLLGICPRCFGTGREPV